MKTKISQEIGKTIIDDYIADDGSSWYRIWSDGWIEQGGYALGSGTTVTFNFPKEFKNVNYTSSITARASTYPNTDTGGADMTPYVINATTTLIKVSRAHPIYIYCCGY